MKMYIIKNSLYMLIFMMAFSCIGSGQLDTFDGDNELLNCVTSFLDRFKRPFTALEITQSLDNSLLLQCAYAYLESVFVCIHRGNADYASQMASKDEFSESKEPFDNVIVLNKKFTVSDLELLGECEHVDLVIVPSMKLVPHADWKCFVDAVLHVGDYVLFDVTFPTHMQSEVPRYVCGKHSEQTVDLPCYTEGFVRKLYFVHTCKTSLERNSWLSPRHSHKRYEIVADFDQKLLKKYIPHAPSYPMISRWISGINVTTFKMCEGIYPSSQVIIDALKDNAVDHPDWTMLNMVLQGHRVQLIDGDDPRDSKSSGARRYSPAWYQVYKELLLLQNPAEIESFFRTKLMRRYLALRAEYKKQVK